jgi:uncharacterized protein
LLFVATCLDRPGRLQVRLDTRPTHLDYLKGLHSKVKIGGALLGVDNQTPVGSLLIFEAADADEVRAILDADPYAKAELFASVEIKPWRQAVGVPLT